MFWLLACAPPAPGVALPAAPAAEHAEALPAARLLTPTALGASSDLLCGWARGEPTPEASLARWLAEERLVWRVYDAEAGTFAGRPAGTGGRWSTAEEAAAIALTDAADQLDARCGSTLPRDVLVAAGPGRDGGGVTAAVYALGQARWSTFWLLADDASPGPAAPATGGCVVVTVDAAEPWSAAAARVDAGRGTGAEVLLAATVAKPAPPGRTGAPTAGRTYALTAAIPALPVQTPRYCAGGAEGCGCAAALLTAPGASPP